MASLTPCERARRIAVVPQFLPTLFDVRVEDFVLGGRYAHVDRWKGPTHLDREAVQAALADCDVSEFAQRLMSELSGGQRQRVVIARAIAQAAPVVLVDEPTSSLDPEHQVRVFELLAGLAREGRSVLVVTHELSLAGQFAGQLLVLERGRLVDGARPARVGEGQRAALDRAHHAAISRRERTSRNRKNGPPTSDIITPGWSAPSPSTRRCSRSAPSRKTAPAGIESASSVR